MGGEDLRGEDYIYATTTHFTLAECLLWPKLVQALRESVVRVSKTHRFVELTGLVLNAAGDVESAALGVLIKFPDTLPSASLPYSQQSKESFMSGPRRKVASPFMFALKSAISFMYPGKFEVVERWLNSGLPDVEVVYQMTSNQQLLDCDGELAAVVRAIKGHATA
ncbi:hypothetical protein FOA52_011907 [Chlamydomonas sp. UWO 241]|nr:hypothetical protein FOA52_011907 [Chlamydomonas sp. UWO 241]